jgi:hypothetical protein
MAGRGRKRERTPFHRRRGDRLAARADSANCRRSWNGAGAARTGRAGAARRARAGQQRRAGTARGRVLAARVPQQVAGTCRQLGVMACNSNSNALVGELARCEESAEAMHAEDLEPRLQEALDHRVAHEHALAHARDALESAANGLRALDEQRLKVEQSLDPLRDRIGELKLKEQAASSPSSSSRRNWRRPAPTNSRCTTNSPARAGQPCRVRLPRCSARSRRSVRSIWPHSTNSKRRANARAISMPVGRPDAGDGDAGKRDSPH